MDWIQQWQSKLNKQNEVAPLVRTGGSRHTGLAALPYRNIQARGYFVSTVGNVNEETVRKYIQEQEENDKLEDGRK